MRIVDGVAGCAVTEAGGESVGADAKVVDGEDLVVDVEAAVEGRCAAGNDGDDGAAGVVFGGDAEEGLVVGGRVGEAQAEPVEGFG